ncbi:MAG: hypothetical protein VYA34_09070 [Myxococcota bacterium]|nr:hypothetical protein [Myxococcota bacterium]
MLAEHTYAHHLQKLAQIVERKLSHKSRSLPGSGKGGPIGLGGYCLAPVVGLLHLSLIGVSAVDDGSGQSHCLLIENTRLPYTSFFSFAIPGALAATHSSVDANAFFTGMALLPWPKIICGPILDGVTFMGLGVKRW